MSGWLLQFSKGCRVEPTTISAERGRETTNSKVLLRLPTPKPELLNGHSWLKENKWQAARALHTTTTTMTTIRGRRAKRRQEDKETTTTGVTTTMVCRRVCDNDHHYKKEDERLTTMTEDMTGQGKGTTTTTMTRKTAMTTIMQDRLQESCRIDYRRGPTTKEKQ